MLKPLTLRQARQDPVSHADSSSPSNSAVAPPPPADLDTSAQNTYHGQQHQHQQQDPQFIIMERNNSNQMDVDDVGSDDRSRRATSVLSMDDIEAAQALEGLRSGKTISAIPYHFHGLSGI